MLRPQFQALMESVRMGLTKRVVVWRLDRLGRTASGLTSLFEELQQRQVTLLSLKDGFDLSTASGRLFANMLMSIAVFENEMKSERIRAGIQAKLEAGTLKYRGGKPGRVCDPKKADRAKLAKTMALAAAAAGEPVNISHIARLLDVSRSTARGYITGSFTPRGATQLTSPHRTAP